MIGSHISVSNNILDSSILVSESAIVIYSDDSVRTLVRILTVFSSGISLSQDLVSYRIFMLFSFCILSLVVLANSFLFSITNTCPICFKLHIYHRIPSEY